MMKCLVLAILSSTILSTQAQDLPSTPTSFQSSSVTSTSIINLAWSQAPGEVVDTYDIIYNFTIIGCSITGLNVMVSGVNGSLRQYTLTTLQENSVHTINITARNEAGVSAPAQTTATTDIAAPSAPPRNLHVTDTTFTSITVEWEEVPCEHRNVEITHYLWRFINNDNPYNDGDMVRADVLGRNFTGLIPRNNYTIQVLAQHVDFSVTVLVLSGPPANLTAVTGVPPGLGFLLRGTPYSNNSVVALTRIGQSARDSLYCLTDYTSCCREEEGGAAGEWFLPSGQTVPVGSVGTDFTSTRAPSAVVLTHLTTTGPSGVYTCQIPDTSGQLRTLYVGVDLTGALSILDLEYNRTSLTLTCTSRGRPVHSITWLKDNTVVGTEFSQGQTITDAVSATYQHTLRGDDIAALVGSFTCRVGDAEGNTVSRTLILNGVDLDVTEFVIGGVAMVTCSSDDGVADRIEIVSSTGLSTSQMSVQTLTLTIDLVTDTLHNSLITCSVTRDMGTSMESVSNQTIPISVTVPSDPLTASVNRTGSHVAGSQLSLNCIVMAVPGFTANMPTAVWREDDGDAIVSEGDITIQTTQDNRVSVATLTFAPVRGSHGVVYMCTGGLLTPAQPDTPLQVSTMEDLRIQIPTPIVTLPQPPQPLVAGSADNTVLTCSAMVDESVVDRGTLHYAYTWRDRNGRRIMSEARTSISASDRSPSASSTLTLSPLSTVDTNFTCAVTVTEVQNTLQGSGVEEMSVSLTVTIPDNPVVEIVSSGTSTAGNTLTLTCTVTLQQTLRVPPVIVWIGPDGTEIRNGTVEDVTMSSFVGVLTFSPLRTSHGGVYTCRASVDIPLAAVSISSNQTNTVTVQIPPPIVNITGSPVSSDFFTGLQLTLTCSIHIPQVLNSEPLEVSAQWARDGSPFTSSARVTVGEEPLGVGPLLYESTVVFNSLNGSGDGGVYACMAAINSSDAASSQFHISVETTVVQLELSGICDCSSWKHENYLDVVADALVNNVAPRCECDFAKDRVTDPVFQCSPTSPQSVIFQAQLHGTLNATISQLIEDIEEWVFAGNELQVEPSLTVFRACAVNSTSSLMLCPGEETPPPLSECDVTSPTSSSITTTTIAVIAAISAVVLVIVVLVLLVIILCALKKKCSRDSHKKRLEADVDLEAIDNGRMDEVENSTGLPADEAVTSVTFVAGPRPEVGLSETSKWDEDTDTKSAEEDDS